MGQISRKRDYDDAGLAAESTPSKRNRQPPPSIGIHEMNGSQEHGDTITSTSVSGDSTGPTNDSSSGISEGSIDHDVFPDDDEDRTSSSSSSSSSSEEGRSSADLSEDENDGGKSSVGDSSEVYKANDSDSESEPARGEDDDPITFVSHRPKPQFQRVNESSLFSRVSSFLPRLRAANEDLERQITSGLAQDVIMNDIDDGNQGQYIEMNLGLGVLETKNDNIGSPQGTDFHSEESSDDSHGSEIDSSVATSYGRRKPGVLDRLMGNRTKLKKLGIEEVER